MPFTTVSVEDRIATATLSRGKVNALNEEVVEDLHGALSRCAEDPGIGSVILTGQGKFFSFGFDIPEFLTCSRGDFSRYLKKFTDLYTYAFMYPKPIVAALNGHTIAGGCMLALACDHRIMVGGKARISLNEIGFGASVFAGSVEMLRFWLGGGRSTQVLYSGAMYAAEEAREIGLVHAVAPEEGLMAEARSVAADLGRRSNPAFTSIKKLLRSPVVEQMRAREEPSLRDFVEIWYSEATWENLKGITIR